MHSLGKGYDFMDFPYDIQHHILRLSVHKVRQFIFKNRTRTPTLYVDNLFKNGDDLTIALGKSRNQFDLNLDEFEQLLNLQSLESLSCLAIRFGNRIGYEFARLKSICKKHVNLRETKYYFDERILKYLYRQRNCWLDPSVIGSKVSEIICKQGVDYPSEFNQMCIHRCKLMSKFVTGGDLRLAYGGAKLKILEAQNISLDSETEFYELSPFLDRLYLKNYWLRPIEIARSTALTQLHLVNTVCPHFDLHRFERPNTNLKVLTWINVQDPEGENINFEVLTNKDLILNYDELKIREYLKMDFSTSLMYHFVIRFQ